ncbi:hypothetical protein [Rosenbergiella epipactidis]|uniref:hypothetical protein n=1 Tax=Rosenbergiella epipactidis TaxID=1544694 RepID=UPI001F4DBC8D|nr:hypothetical protein [Rosenbergiella epipactidis]
MKEASLQSPHESRTATNLSYAEVEAMISATNGNVTFYRPDWSDGHFLYIDSDSNTPHLVMTNKLCGPAKLSPDDVLASDWILEVA